MSRLSKVRSNNQPKNIVVKWKFPVRFRSLFTAVDNPLENNSTGSRSWAYISLLFVCRSGRRRTLRQLRCRLELDPVVYLPEPTGLQGEGWRNSGCFLWAIARDTLRPTNDDLRPNALQGIPATGERFVSSYSCIDSFILLSLIFVFLLSRLLLTRCCRFYVFFLFRRSFQNNKTL